jgi:hypothetical protein
MKLFISDPAVLAHVYAPEHEKSRHTERRHGWLHELQDTENLTFPLVNPSANLSRFFTGDVKRGSFIKIRNLLMNVGSRAMTGLEERGDVTTT